MLGYHTFFLACGSVCKNVSCIHFQFQLLTCAKNKLLTDAHPTILEHLLVRLSTKIRESGKGEGGRGKGERGEVEGERGRGTAAQSHSEMDKQSSGRSI